MAKKITTVLFDLDGTLLDSASELHACLNELLTQYEKPLVPLIKMQSRLNMGARGFIEMGFGSQLAPSEHQRLTEEFLHLYHEHLLHRACHFFPGTLALLEALQKKELALGIVTNKDARFTLPILKNLNLLDTFKVVVCGDQVTQAKPSPEPLYLACRQGDFSVETCCYVGDSLQDMQAAVAAPMPGLLACWGYWQRLRYPVDTWPASARCFSPDQVMSFLS